MPAFFFVCALANSSLSQNGSAWWTTLYHDGLELIEQKQYAAARSRFESMLQRDKKVAQGHYGLALSLAAEKPDSREALKHFRKATQIDPQYAEAYYQSGLVYANMKRYNNARTAFRTATQKDPSLVEAWLKLGEIEAASGGSSGVVAAYKNAYRNVPGNAALYEKFLGAAILYHEEDDAIAFLEELSGKPGHQHRRLDVAYLHYMNGDIDKSASIAGAISPEKASARTNLLRAVFNSFSGSMMKSGTKPAK